MSRNIPPRKRYSTRDEDAKILPKKQYIKDDPEISNIFGCYGVDFSLKTGHRPSN